MFLIWHGRNFRYTMYWFTLYPVHSQLGETGKYHPVASLSLRWRLYTLCGYIFTLSEIFEMLLQWCRLYTLYDYIFKLSEIFEMLLQQNMALCTCTSAAMEAFSATAVCLVPGQSEAAIGPNWPMRGASLLSFQLLTSIYLFIMVYLVWLERLVW